jgi:hypothetical protein
MSIPYGTGRDERRARNGEVDAARARLARHAHDAPRGVAAHDRVVDEQHVLALELERDRVELAAHRGLARALAGMMNVRPM